MVQDAVIRNFEIIGEAASRLSPAIRGNGNIPWARVIALSQSSDPRLSPRVRSVPLAVVQSLADFLEDCSNRP
jgi:hypothetical protein